MSAVVQIECARKETRNLNPSACYFVASLEFRDTAARVGALAMKPIGRWQKMHINLVAQFDRFGKLSSIDDEASNDDSIDRGDDARRHTT